MKVPNRKFAIKALCDTIEHSIPRLQDLNQCDEIEGRVNKMYKSGLINYSLYIRWKNGISNARKLLEEEA